MPRWILFLVCSLSLSAMATMADTRLVRMAQQDLVTLGYSAAARNLGMTEDEIEQSRKPS